jgi:MFS transporter, DHA2 family, methylenomycin A resistance protein
LATAWFSSTSSSIPQLNSIGTSLGGGVSELQWVVSSYTIAFAAFILTAGALGDRIGAKRIFMAGFAIFTAASVGCALAPNAAIPIAARSVQRLGAAIRRGAATATSS